ncbi:MAG TPA: hypothetical protein VFU23_09785 [Gemmatimonadales bacterium]|nr:hypothetical protein [Gemmatimonadales bacterium]
MTVMAMKRWIRGAVVAAMGLGAAGATTAEECLDPPPPQPVPPLEAFDACRTGVESGGCEVVLPDQTVAGLCVTAPSGELFCRPFIPPPPPPEAFAACQGLAAASACGIQLDCGVVRGTCESTPTGEPFCLPLFAPRP